MKNLKQKLRFYHYLMFNKLAIIPDTLNDITYHIIQKHYSLYYNKKIYRGIYLFSITSLIFYMMANYVGYHYIQNQFPIPQQTQYDLLVQNISQKKKGYKRFQFQAIVQLLNKGIQRGLLPFQLMQVVETQKIPELKWHGKYLAQLKS